MNLRRSILLPVLLMGAAMVAIQMGVTAAGKSYYLTQLVMVAYYSILVMGLCLVMGYAGQVSMGHAAFFAIGGYTSAVLTTRDIPAAHAAGGWGETLLKAGLLQSRSGTFGEDIVCVNPWCAFAVALLLATVIALLIGWPALKLKGHYLAMATLGFGLIVYRIVLGTEFLGTADGIHGVPPWNLGFGLVVCGRRVHRVANYYVAWSLALLVLLLLLNIVRSRAGRALRAIHGGEDAANAMGVNTAACKLQAFVFSAILAAAAGCLLTHYYGGIGPSEAGALKSVRYVALVAAGGMANLWGALLVSALLNFLSLRGCFGTLDNAVFGAVLIAIVSLAPEGPFRPLRDLLFRLVKRNRQPADHSTRDKAADGGSYGTA